MVSTTLVGGAAGWSVVERTVGVKPRRRRRRRQRRRGPQCCGEEGAGTQVWLVSAGGGRCGAGETGYLPASAREGHVGLMVPPPGDLNLTFHILDFPGVHYFISETGIMFYF